MPETIGQQLRAAREARNLTLGKVTQAIHVQARLLEAMEADNFESLPSPVQARAFLRMYAEFLGLSLEKLIARQRPVEEPIEANVPELSSPGLEEDDVDVHELQANGTLEVSDEALKDEPPAENLISESRGSQAFFKAIGEALRQHREVLSLTLEEIEQHIHVRTHYLQALEVGDFDHLPSSVQARGMLSNYAHFLDMDVDAILLQFAEGLQMQRLERHPEQAEKNTADGISPYPREAKPTSIRRYLSMDVIVGVGLIISLLGFAIWGTSRVMALRSATTPQPTVQSISNLLQASPQAGTGTPSPTGNGEAGTSLPSANTTINVTLPAAGQGPVQIVVVALDEAYVRVTVDGVKQFDGRISAGSAQPFSGNSQIEVLTGSGASISILYNQSNLGPMGNLGEVVDRIYTAKAILNPTATFTPTPTITPTPTRTLHPSATPRFTATAVKPTATK